MISPLVLVFETPGLNTIKRGLYFKDFSCLFYVKPLWKCDANFFPIIFSREFSCVPYRSINLKTALMVGRTIFEKKGCHGNLKAENNIVRIKKIKIIQHWEKSKSHC